jgi:hypothetical protein
VVAFLLSKKLKPHFFTLRQNHQQSNHELLYSLERIFSLVAIFTIADTHIPFRLCVCYPPCPDLLPDDTLGCVTPLLLPSLLWSPLHRLPLLPPIPFLRALLMVRTRTSLDSEEEVKLLPQRRRV